MLELSELDNEVTKRQLHKTFSNKVDIKFGLDANKIKGVNNFPIYYETDGFSSHAKKNVDSFMFHGAFGTNKYDVKKSTHTSVGEIRPYLYDKQSPSQPKNSNVRMRQGEMSSLYGLPPDRNIVLESPAGQAMGPTTERQFRDKQWRENPGEIGNSTLPAELESIISGGDSSSLPPPPPPSAGGSGSASATSTAEPEHEQVIEPVVKPKKADKPLVTPAFDKTPEKTVEGLSTPGKMNKTKLIKDMDSFFESKSKTGNITDEDKTKMNSLLKENGFKIPNKAIKKVSAYMKAFESAVTDKKTPNKTPKTPKTPQTLTTEEKAPKKITITPKKKKTSLLQEFATEEVIKDALLDEETQRIH